MTITDKINAANSIKYGAVCKRCEMYESICGCNVKKEDLSLVYDMKSGVNVYRVNLKRK